MVEITTRCCPWQILLITPSICNLHFNF